MTFHRARPEAPRIILRAAGENLSRILVLTLAATDFVDRLASSAARRTRDSPEARAAPLPGFSLAASFTVPALLRVLVTAAFPNACFFFALSFWTSFDCGSTRKAPLIKGWIRQK